MKRLLNTISPSHAKVFWTVLFILFINQFHRFEILRPIWALFPEHYLVEFLFYLLIPITLCSFRQSSIFSKELEDFSFTLITSVKEGYIFLSKFDFQLIYVILSGTLAEEFLDTYEENLRNLSVLTLNIIFCFRNYL